MRPAAVILGVVLILFSCGEESTEYAFEGVVTVSGVGVPLEGVVVTLRGQRLTGTSFNPNFQTLDTDVTDADGRFSLSVEKALFQSFRITLDHPYHFVTVRDISPDDVPISSAYTGSYQLEPLAWVGTHLRNVNASQRIDVTIDAQSDGCAECCDQLRIVREGEVFDTTFTCLAFGGGQVTHKGNFRNAGGTVTLINLEGASVAYDTLFVEITY